MNKIRYECLDLAEVGQELDAVFCQHNNEPSGSIEVKKSIY
jgi:hypothetical protein